MCNSVSLINSSAQRNFSFHGINSKTKKTKIEFRPGVRFGQEVKRLFAEGHSSHDIGTNFSASKLLDIRP